MIPQVEKLKKKKEITRFGQLTDTQKESLEMLRLIHEICLRENLRYTLTGDALITGFAGLGFAGGSPYFTIALLYADYLCLLDCLARYCTEHTQFELINTDNTSQFDAIYTRLTKAGKVTLPEGRRQDELYYRNYLTIMPVFFAGNTPETYNAACECYIETMRAVTARAVAPERPLTRRPLKLRKHNSYLCKRDTASISSLIESLACYSEPTKYAYMPGGKPKPDCELARYYQDVHTIAFEGVDCYVLDEASTYIDEHYTKRKIATVCTERKSQLITNGPEMLRRIQLIQLDLLVEFDRICRKNNLNYVLSFGTLLGAVRHGGFVPWDDDVDVLMPYDDYVKLDAAMEADLDKEKYFLRTQENDPDCNITYKHLKRNGTVYAKPGRDEYTFHPGVFLDIVPLFNGANNKLLHRLHTRLGWFFRTATWAHMGAGGERKWRKRMYYKALAKLGNKRAYALFLRVATMFKKKRGKMIFFNGMDRSPYNRAFVKASGIENRIEMAFEGHLFFAPSNYHEILSYVYSDDYMLFLPVSMRFPAHDAVIDIGHLHAYDHNEKI